MSAGYYAVDTGDGNELCSGLTPEIAREAAFTRELCIGLYPDDDIGGGTHVSLTRANAFNHDHIGWCCSDAAVATMLGPRRWREVERLARFKRCKTFIDQHLGPVEKAVPPRKVISREQSCVESRSKFSGDCRLAAGAAAIDEDDEWTVAAVLENQIAEVSE